MTIRRMTRCVLALIVVIALIIRIMLEGWTQMLKYPSASILKQSGSRIVRSDVRRRRLLS